ncbi:TapY2 family type IVa secretion system protein [Shewanella colwelliana]|uniref:Uncharacterized protein n=1 Tax=Shewanella colwelliana TaxID=23 RepID=A0ABQ4NZX0_SHECO|nr:TapY2 family type IVa secretion system protein [Shewanella colwelliana]GIU40719.1 hypothetical protein TUM3794_19310 [Shewanella colwelliana]
MKVITLLIMFLASVSLQAAAETEMREAYKCHVNTTGGEKVLGYSWYPSKAKLYMRKLPAKRLPSLPSYGPKPLYIKSVVECVKHVERFSSQKSRDMDEQQAQNG